MKINEIFYSLQGEGHYTGTPAVFVRFSGCNLKCPFCDTDHLKHTELSEQEIVEAVAIFGAKHVVITGGEPTLQLTASLVGLLHERGFFVQIETNGSHRLPDGCDVDWVTCSPKDGAPIRLEHIDELKVLFHGNGKCDIQAWENTKAQCYSLQPLDTQDDELNKEILRETIDYILDHPMWRLSLQTHKMTGIK